MAETSIAPPTAAADRPQTRPRILAIDDQLDSLRFLQLRLEAGGMECLTYADGAAALKFLEHELVDVVILDVMMPQMDGYEFCRRLKANLRTRDIPVIFITAKIDAADRAQGLEIGGHDYLSKPVHPQELLARTRAALRVKFLQDQFKQQIQLQQEIHQLHRGMLSEHWQKTFGQLAASLAHEINNPLAAALGAVQLLNMQPALAKDIVQPLQIIDHSLQRVGQKLRSLLLIAQPISRPRKVLLAGLVQDILTVINYQVVINKIAVVSRLDETAEWDGVPGDLARVLLYILNNAIEAVIDRPAPTITLKVENVDSRPTIRIADNGPGIPASIHDRIFEPFFSTKGAAHHGIGLYLASEILKTIGGRIELHSDSGLTEFVLSLPINSTSSKR
jgi:two-component system NtrC family sensor kinase